MIPESRMPNSIGLAISLGDAVGGIMNLFEDIEAENEKYINVIDALEVLSKKINYEVSDIAKRLLLDKFNQTACMFKINDYEQIELWCSEKKFNGGYISTTDFLELAISTSGAFDHVEIDNYGNEYEYTKDYWFDFYWLKSDFFNYPSVIKMGITEKSFENILKAYNEEKLYDLFDKHVRYDQAKMTIEEAKKTSQRFFKEQEELNFNENTSTSCIPLFYLSDSFSIIEAACLLSGDDPIQINRCVNDTNFDQNHPKFSEAYNFVNSAIFAGVLPKCGIPADQLKSYFKNKGKIIVGFNNIPFSQQNSSDNFEYANTLKINISKELDSNFIKIFTVVDFLKKMTSLRYDEITIHIKKIFNNLTLYTLDENLTPVTGYEFCDGACIDHLSNFLDDADENIIMLSAARHSVDEYFWDKNEFFSNKDVIAFDLSRKNYNLFLIASLLNPDDEHIFLNNSDINILKKILNNRNQDLNAYIQVEFDKLKKNDDLLISKNNFETLKEENEDLKSKLMQSQEQITKLQINQKISDIPDELKGLSRINQLSQDRQGMARIFALSLWEKNKNILIGDMADQVYRLMIDYCKDDLPELPDSLKTWLRPIAPPEAQKKGRPPNKSNT